MDNMHEPDSQEQLKPETSRMSLSEMSEHFVLPIQYNNNMILHKTIATDLELIKSESDDCKPVYQYAFQPSTDTGKYIMNQVAQYYSSNISFLKDTQKLVRKYKIMQSSTIFAHLEQTQNIWFNIKNDTGFKEKYHYIEWDNWEHLNHSESFLELMSVYSLTSPLISLCIPIVLLVIPFFVIRIKGLKVTMGEYIEVLKTIASNHSIGKLFTNFNDVDMQGKVYLLVSAAFYIFSIYQNALVCYKFHQNMYKIHEYLENIQEHIECSIDEMTHFLSYSESYKTYAQFNFIMKGKISKLSEMKKQLERISPYELTVFKIKELGTVLKCFYDMYSNQEYHETILYSFGFCGYIDIIQGLQQNIQNKHISFAKLSNKSSTKTYFKDAYYPSLMYEKPVKNICDFKKNMIITGPNASGKTTILKTTLINTILTQQFGCGFYSKASLRPYNYIHCYLNIPDTSGRDSLFQSETRKCNDIIKSIKKNSSNKSHFCVFDELYSGTNPEEAAKCGYAFLLYLSQQRNVTFALTTHYLKICENLNDNVNTQNYQMLVEKNPGENMVYKYQILEGITKVDGGVEVLKQMDYPQEIMDTIAEITPTEKNFETIPH